MQNQITTTEFKKPYQQPALQGYLGLTDQDIAESLGVTSKQVRQKIRRDQWCVLEEWKPVAHTTFNKNDVLNKN